ncbi:glycoprotein-polysaccharide metabolism protein [Haematobacter missouriensis]|nr:YbaY family lipoprotein [Haematobacter missouriensis]KFI27053.1 glycoprotein-polysaccharide metabolism protein [Haematobacter missouriensis]
MIRSRLPAFAILATAVMAGPLSAETLRGTVTYRERMALPPGAEVEVKLLDVSRADAPATILAETTLRPGHAAPFPFALEYDAAAIAQGHSYALQARITAGERLLFITTTRHPAFENPAGQAEIVVERVTTPATTPTTTPAATPTGTWRLESVGDQPAEEGVQAVIEIAADGTLSGSGGCNMITGKARIEGEHIDFGRIASTMMACPPLAMEQERALFHALAAARRWQSDPTGQVLVLLDEAGAGIAAFRATER